MQSATRITVSAFGTLVGVAGLEHGIGEILQGNVTPDGVMILSWPGSGPFSMIGGEPAMTIIPNLLIAGILTVFFSLIFILWATLFIQRPHGGSVLALLSIVLLLVGGGIFPPVFGLILGAAATRIHSRFTWWQAHTPVGLQHFLAKLWQWSLCAGLIAWLLMFPGVPLLALFFRVADSPELVSIILFGMLGFFFSTIITGFAFDGLREMNVPSTYAAQQPRSTATFEWKSE